MSELITKAEVNENLEILLGLPRKIEAGVQTSINYVVICTHAGSPELVSSENDLFVVRDEDGRDVTNYYWWARPGKYTVDVVTFAICPAIGPEKAPRNLTYLTNPPPISGLKSYDYDKLRAALDANPPSSLEVEDKSFTHRSSPFNAKLINLRLNIEPTNATVSDLNFNSNSDSQPTDVQLQTLT